MTTFNNAGTVADFLVRHGFCHRLHVSDWIRAWTVLVNGIRTVEAQRILERGDILTVDGRVYAL